MMDADVQQQMEDQLDRITNDMAHVIEELKAQKVRADTAEAKLSEIDAQQSTKDMLEQVTEAVAAGFKSNGKASPVFSRIQLISIASGQAN